MKPSSERSCLLSTLTRGNPNTSKYSVGCPELHKLWLLLLLAPSGGTRKRGCLLPTAFERQTCLACVEGQSSERADRLHFMKRKLELKKPPRTLVTTKVTTKHRLQHPPPHWLELHPIKWPISISAGLIMVAKQPSITVLE